MQDYFKNQPNPDFQTKKKRLDLRRFPDILT